MTGEVSFKMLASIYIVLTHCADFWQEPRRFDNIADPLLEQVARCARNEQALSVLVAKTLESFVLAAYRVDQRVHVNEQLLKLLKHEEAKVRIAAIGCQIQLLDRLGDDWTSMLSQMLPAINEVLEDDSEEVEKQAKKWVRKLEKTLNQDIKEMLQ